MRRHFVSQWKVINSFKLCRRVCGTNKHVKLYIIKINKSAWTLCQFISHYESDVPTSGRQNIAPYGREELVCVCIIDFWVHYYTFPITRIIEKACYICK